jgi:hypothetical protein
VPADAKAAALGCLLLAACGPWVLPGQDAEDSSSSPAESSSSAGPMQQSGTDAGDASSSTTWSSSSSTSDGSSSEASTASSSGEASTSSSTSTGADEESTAETGPLCVPGLPCWCEWLDPPQPCPEETTT